MKIEDIDFYELVDKLWHPVHDGNPKTLSNMMLVAKLNYMMEHEFSSYEEEVQWMADYLKEYWNEF